MKAPITSLGRLPGPEHIDGPEALYDAMHAAVCDWYRGHPRHAEHPWHLVLLLSDGRAYVVDVGDIDGPASKHRAFHAHQNALNFPGGPGGFTVVCSGLICEAWLRLMRPGEERLFDSLAEDPKATESVLFNLLTHDRQAMMSCPIDRTGALGATIEKAAFNWLPDDALGAAVRRREDSR
jgi:hypothetical protein